MKEWKLRLCQMALEVRRKVTEVSLKEQAMQRRAEFQILVQKKGFCGCFAVILDFCWLSSLFLNRRKEVHFRATFKCCTEIFLKKAEITEYCNTFFAESSNLVKSVKNIFC